MTVMPSRLGDIVIRLTATMALAVAVTACVTRSDNPIEGTGTIEVDEVDIAAMTPARVTRLWTDEGKSVRAGDTLVTLRVPRLKQDIAALEAQARAAEAHLRDLERGARPNEIARAEDELRAAEADATRTARDLARIAALARNGTVSQLSLDAARGAASSAAARRDAARNALRLIREGTRPDQIAAARADVAAARAAARAGKESENDLTLTAPTDGVVLTRNVLPGEVLAGGIPALTVGVTSRPWVHVYVDERALPRIRVGDSVTATLDAYPERAFRGRVIALRDRAEFTPRIALTERERAELLFAVKVALTDSAGALKPGLAVTVRIQSRAAP